MLGSNEKQFRGGLVFKARRLVVSLKSRPRIITKRGGGDLERVGVDGREFHLGLLRESVLVK